MMVVINSIGSTTTIIMRMVFEKFASSLLESTGYLIMGLYETRDIATGVSAHALGCMHAARRSGTLQPTFPLMSWSPGMARLCPRRCSSLHPGKMELQIENLRWEASLAMVDFIGSFPPYRRYLAAPPIQIRDALPRPWSRCRLPLQHRRLERGVDKNGDL